jgi:polypeptide deformylase
MWPEGAGLAANQVEGCLSVPGAGMAVPRTDRAVARGFDKDGNPLVIEGTGYFARCLQHGTVHLVGHTYPDRLSKRDRKDALRQLTERREDVFAQRAIKASRLRVISSSAEAPGGAQDAPMGDPEIAGSTSTEPQALLRTCMNFPQRRTLPVRSDDTGGGAMANILSRAVTYIRDGISGRRRLERYNDPEAHRRGPNVRDSRTVEQYRVNGTNDPGPFG